MKKEQKEKKLRLGKITVEQFRDDLDNEELQNVKGGIDTMEVGTTSMPIFCL